MNTGALHVMKKYKKDSRCHRRGSFSYSAAGYDLESGSRVRERHARWWHPDGTMPRTNPCAPYRAIIAVSLW